MPRPFWLFLLGALACTPSSRPSPLAGIPRQDSIRVDFYWQTPDAVPPHTLTDSVQIAAVMAILQGPGEWRLEEIRYSYSEQRLFLTDSTGARVRVGFCPDLLTTVTGKVRLERDLSWNDYAQLMQLTGSEPFSYNGDTSLAVRTKTCRLRGHYWWERVENIVILSGLLLIVILTIQFGVTVRRWRRMRRA
jgi:hypothetical protein